MDSPETCEWPGGCDRPKAPAVGPGRPRKFCGLPDPDTGVAHTADERARQFGRQGQAAAPAAVTTADGQSVLAQTLQRLAVLAGDFRADADRVEAAIDAINNPDALAAALEACRTSADETMAAAAAKVAAAERDRVEAEAAAERSESEANALHNANVDLADRVTELEGELQGQRDANEASSAAYEANLVLLRERAAEERAIQETAHRTEIAGLEDAHEAEMGEVHRRVEATMAERAEQHQRAVDELRGQVADLERRVGYAVEDRDRAQADAASAREGLARLQAEIPELVERARNEANEMANLRITAITGGAEELMAATTARLEAERDAAGTLLATEKDRNEYLMERITDLVDQIEALRAQLAGQD